MPRPLGLPFFSTLSQVRALALRKRQVGSRQSAVGSPDSGSTADSLQPSGLKLRLARHGLVFLTVALCLFSTLAAQLADPGPSRGRSAPFSLNFHVPFGHGGHGFFGGGFGRGFLSHPFHFVPLHFPFHQPFFFDGRARHGRGRHFAGPDSFRFHAGPAGGAPFFFDSGYYNYNTLVVGSDRGGWDWFVEEWKDQDPRQEQQDPSDPLSESLLLQEGMSQDEVIRILGSPLQRVQLANREIWKYSGYSLLFEGGALKEMR